MKVNFRTAHLFSFSVFFDKLPQHYSLKRIIVCVHTYTHRCACTYRYPHIFLLVLQSNCALSGSLMKYLFYQNFQFSLILVEIVNNLCFIWRGISESSLLSSLQFGPEDGWLPSFYACLIKKVRRAKFIFLLW